jgi:hypothetical protein
MPIDGTSYYIEHIDDLNWTLCKTGVVEDAKKAKPENIGKATSSTLSYHPSLGHALLAAARLMADDEGPLSDIESYIDRLHAIEQRLREIGA